MTADQLEQVHIMFDLETWGTEPGCDLRSIGAVVFEPYRYRSLGPDFYVNVIDGEACGLVRNPKTVQWWSDQSEEAQAAFKVGPAFSLPIALDMFSKYVQLCAPDPTKLRLWSHGPGFDVAILTEAYRAAGLPIPWHYRAPRDTRTAFDMAGMDPTDCLAAFATGTHHHALHDARGQSEAVCEAYRRVTQRITHRPTMSFARGIPHAPIDMGLRVPILTPEQAAKLDGLALDIIADSDTTDKDT